MGTVENGLMPRILKQAQVELDLLEIWLYTFNQWGENQADDYLDDLGTAIELLANQPQMCRQRHEFKPPVRIHHHAHHLIVYTALDDGVHLIRILHEEMDVTSQLD